MRLVVTGASGYLGSHVARRAEELGWDVVAVGFSRPGLPPVDVRDAAAVARLVRAADAVVHTAYVQDGSDAWSVTVEGAETVARAARAARLLHLSTDVVFGGEREGRYREGDEPSPVTDYGRAKAEAERRVGRTHPEALVVRTSLIYGGRGAETSKHERLPPEATFYTDELRCPVQVHDLAGALLELVEADVSGPLHAAGPEVLSRYELARLFALSQGTDPDGIRGGLAPPGRPRNCALDSSRARDLLQTELRGARSVLAYRSEE